MIRPGAASWAVPGRFCVPADACQTSASAVLWVCVGGGGVCSVCWAVGGCVCGSWWWLCLGCFLVGFDGGGGFRYGFPGCCFGGGVVGWFCWLVLLAGSGIVVLWFRGWCGRVGRVAL